MSRRGRMVVEFTATCAIVAYHHLSCGFEPHSWRGVLDKTLLLPRYWGRFHGLSMLLLNWSKIVWSKRSRCLLGTIQQIALTFSNMCITVPIIVWETILWKKLLWMKWCLLYFYLTFVYNCYVPTYHRFLRQRLLLKYQNVI
jgi:hypothetical protein